MTHTMLTMGAAIERNAIHFSNCEAFVFESKRLTHGEYATRALQLASALHRLGLHRQDRVAILAMNCVEYYEVYGAGEIAGFITAPVNFRLALPEMIHMLKDAAPKILVFEASFAARVAELRPALGDIQHFISIGPCGFDWAVAYEDVVTSGGIAGPPFRARADDYAYLYYTSGTTGRPKGVVHTQEAICVNNARCTAVSGLHGASRILQVTPAFHTGGKGYVGCGTWMGGASVIHQGFDPLKMLQTIAQERITFTFMVAAMVQAVLDMPGSSQYDVSSMERIVSAAAPIPVPLLKRALQRFGPVFCVQYGSTETGNIAHLASHEVFAEGSAEQIGRLASVGHPCPDVAMQVTDEAGNPCDAGAAGEVCVRSQANFSAYWNNHPATIEAFRDGWYLTGDIGYLDREGFLFLVDRRKDMIISGGENVYSREVENALAAHPDITDAAVIGAPDAKWGETVKAVVSLRAGAMLTAPEVISHCRNLLAAYKCPKSVEFVMELPRNASGKVDKAVLRRAYAPPLAGGSP